MLRLLIACVMIGGPLTAALLPEELSLTTKRVALQKLPVSDKAVWEEYGWTDSETARFEGTGRPFTASAWRLKDPTGAQAAFRWLCPAGAGPGNKDQLTYTKFAVSVGDGGLMVFGNYLLRFEGRNPAPDELKILLFQLPNVDQSALPPLLGYLPKDEPVRGTDRYVLGPASLEKFFPGVSPSTAGFHFGAEALIGRYKERSGEVEMAVFYYPTNQMAQNRLPEFQKIEGAMVKRSGPLLAVVLNPPNADDAERLLAKVDYRANVTVSEGTPGSEARRAGDLIMSSFILAGLLLVMGLLAGAIMSGMRYMRRRQAGADGEQAMTTLHLEDR
ncbi:MAG: DUF6599 family protein [Bryobacteraceae bacterium]|nr:DUF6599 family protein [Bryobacteraceae bacterium]